MCIRNMLRRRGVGLRIYSMDKCSVDDILIHIYIYVRV